MNLRHILRSLFRRLIRTPRPQTTHRPKKAALLFEVLDDRIVPSVSFTGSPKGTFAVDNATGATQQVTPAVPITLTEGADGTLFGSYASGTWEYNCATNTMTQLTASPANALAASSDNTLFASYN